VAIVGSFSFPQRSVNQMNTDIDRSIVQKSWCSRWMLRLLVLLVGLLYAANPTCAAFVARSTISWGVGQDDIVTKTGTTTGGAYKLGSLRVQIIGVPVGIDVTTPAKEFTYKFNNTDTLGPLTRSGDSGPLSNTTTVTAQADMTIGPKPANFVVGTPIPYSLKLTAKSNTDWFSPDGYATAKGGDPQFISSPGVFGGMFSIGPGSSVFGTRPGTDLAEATFQLTAFGLSDPLATLDITSGDGHVNAAVHFNSDPRLSFFAPGVLDPLTGLPIPITETKVASILDSDPYLGTAGGTLSALNLFTFRYDLSGATLTSDAALGSSGEADAFSPGAILAPEPTSLTLVGLGVVPLAGYSWRRRKSV
jgi:hypothetical protein